jgi:UDP:flavonoid glycosyltransferase YjiC (YdhE family)
MTASDPKQLTDLLVRATVRSGRRAILLSGWAGLGEAELPPEIFPLAAAPHGWLFPLMAAVVHHGGAGTTAAGLRAGVPSVLVLHLGDAIRQATTDAEMHQRASEISAKIRAEDGVREAVGLIEGWV